MWSTIVTYMSNQTSSNISAHQKIFIQAATLYMYRL